MMVQDFFIDGYGWHVRVYYSTDGRSAGTVLGDLVAIGCRGVELSKARDNLSRGGLDTGLTYSNFSTRETVMALSAASSPAQFLNSWTHEMLHLCRHVSRRFGLDPYGEEAAYLSGSVAQKMFPVARKFLCEHCRKEFA